MNQHPWVKLNVPLPERADLSKVNVTSELPTTVYRHLGKGGYFGARFVKSLFPRKFEGTPFPTNQFPIMEVMRIEHAIDFRTPHLHSLLSATHDARNSLR
ncbi:hypothetical protein Y032_0089g2295 [Ancylostoma ceylanicum]|uniref:Uncharacterized protein n=1 Tax=Ancylostoma ceylanicum TaxID=53326 RepID=A0A016TP27_9BILA|nr:hypothetical protein Y032_0089g2295 [Ancylostoma ceylanicum]